MDGPKIKRLYYSTSEISRICNIKPYIIRKWEKKFLFLNSVKTKKGKKFFKPEDLVIIKKIMKFKDFGLTEVKINEILTKGEQQELNYDQIELKQINPSSVLLTEIYEELLNILKIINNQ